MRRLLRNLPCVLPLLTTPLGLPARPAVAQERPTAITNVSVVPMDTERVLVARTVVIEDRRIAAVGPDSAVTVPVGARMIDGAGLVLIPGLADMHTHFVRPEDLDLLIANGVTTVRLMWGWGRAVAWRDSIAAGTLLGPSMFVASGIFEGTPPPELADVITTQGRIVVNTRAEARWQVAWQRAWGYDFIKVYNNLNREAYAGIVEEARDRGMTVAGHVPFDVGLRGVVAAGQTSVEHLRGSIFESVPPDAPEQPGRDLRSRDLAWRYADTARFPALAEATREAGVSNVPTLSWLLYTRPQEDVDAFLVRPEMIYLPPGARANLRDRSRIPWLSNYTADDFRAATQGNSKREALIRALHRAGAKLMAGTDIGPVGFSLHGELELLVAAGLSPFDALVTATRNPAEFLGWDSGTIEVGKRADLVLLDANPLENISNTRRIRGVMVRDRWMDRKELDGLLERARPR